jgi:PIN domain nuclease of toxin-antitoxin system
MILLDTCVLFWLEQKPDKISRAARQALADPATPCFASSISALELGLKVACKRIELPMEVAAWLREVCSRRAIVELPVLFEIAGADAVLPAIHKDPFDRILIATAMKHNLTLVTPDHFVPQYPNLKTLW